MTVSLASTDGALVMDLDGLASSGGTWVAPWMQRDSHGGTLTGEQVRGVSCADDEAWVLRSTLSDEGTEQSGSIDLSCGLLCASFPDDSGVVSDLPPPDVEVVSW